MGGSDKIKVDLWVILLISKDLVEEIEVECFCEEFYYCLNVVLIVVLFLFECCEDILVLVEYFINGFNEF